MRTIVAASRTHLVAYRRIYYGYVDMKVVTRTATFIDTWECRILWRMHNKIAMILLFIELGVHLTNR